MVSYRSVGRIYCRRDFFLLTGLLYLFFRYKKFLNSLDILDDWRCTYWPVEKQIQVTLWFNDYSNSLSFSAQCVAEFDKQMVKIDDDVTVGGTYLGKSALKSGQDQPIMVEFVKRNIELKNKNTAKIITTIKPSIGLWTAKKKIKTVSVQVINR